MKAEAVEGGRGRRFQVAELAGYGLGVAAVWLAWEVIKAPVAERSAPALAVRIAPGSPEVLRRAAEAELIAGRIENAEVLSNESLAMAPFNARALRVRGLAEARLASVDRADDMLTLAGNWSLRDDPAHAWLTAHRLRRGDYGSAFAHADTLARRREDAYLSVFNLFTIAATQDPRSLPFLARILAAHPPWRRSYLMYLHGRPEGAPIVAGLAIALEPTEGRFTSEELRILYVKWAEAGRFAGLTDLRRRIGRPGLSRRLQNGGFDTPVEEQPIPFGWSFGTGPGFSSGVVEDDLSPDNLAFRLEYDGFGSGVFMEQMLILAPGAYLLRGQRRAETAPDEMRLGWEVTCAETAAVILPTTAAVWGPNGTWEGFAIRFEIPRENCTAQWLRLKPRPEDRRTMIAAWFDKLEIVPAPRAQPATVVSQTP